MNLMGSAINKNMESAQNSLSHERQRRLVKHGPALLEIIHWSVYFLMSLQSNGVIMEHEYRDLQSTSVMYLSGYTSKYQILYRQRSQCVQ